MSFFTRKIKSIDKYISGGSKTLRFDEEQFVDVIGKLLALKDTDCKGHDDKYYVVNNALHYYIVIDEHQAKLTNTTSHISKKMNDAFFYKLQERLDDWLFSHIESFEQTMFASELSMVSKIKTQILNAQELADEPVIDDL